MNIQIGKFMLKRYLFVWGDHEWYAYNEYMLIPSMLITRVCCSLVGILRYRLPLCLSPSTTNCGDYNL